MDSDRIEVQAMPQLAEARGKEDDWTGTVTKEERRRRQNRLNQRAARRRRAERAALDNENTMAEQVSKLRQAGEESPEEVPLSPSASYRTWAPPRPSPIRPAVADPHDLLSVFTSRQLVRLASQTFAPLDRIPEGMNLSLAKRLTRATDLLSQRLNQLSSDHLLSLIHYNLCRGFLVNSIILDLIGVYFCDTVATFRAPRGKALPPCLDPTRVQQTVLHPLWIDLVPSPRIRDNLIRRLGTFDEDELCFDMCGDMCEGDDPSSWRARFVDDKDHGQFARERQGLILWGEPWDTSGWEVTTGFLRSWGWIVEGCPEIIVSSNKWRASRNEAPLHQALLMNAKGL